MITETQQTAESFAIRIAAFIQHNNIDIKKFSMDEIVQRFITAQAKENNLLAKQIESELIKNP